MTARRPPSDPPGSAGERYRTTLAALFERRRFGMKPGLEVIHGVLGALGHPERAYPAIHITGSKGKGSVAAMAQSVLTAHGRRTGRFTSPHLASYRERIQIDGRSIGPEEVVEGLARIDEVARELERTGGIEHAPTFFEVTTALALDWFARRHVDAAVVEVGMGGRLDATNVLDARVGVITTIELEHTELLGSTRSAIAREKSGIFHAGMTGLLGELPADARSTVQSEAGRLGVPLWHLGGELRVEDRALDADGQTFTVRLPGVRLDGLHLPLLGRFQPGNAALAVGAVARFAAATGRGFDPAAVRTGLERVRWRGRLERIARRPELYYDVAHTPDSARAVAQSLAEISPLARTLVVVPVRSARGVPPAELRVAAAGRFPRIVEAPSVASGVRAARAATGTDGFTLVVGSDYLVGELLREEGGADDEPDLSDPGVEVASAGVRGRT